MIAANLDHLQTELDAPEQLGVLLGTVVPRSWPPGHYDRDAIVFLHGRLKEGGAAVVGFYGWYAVRRADADHPATLVASAGYFGPPSADGSVEVGYSVVPEWRRHGYATEIVGALVERAFATPGIERVVADVHEANIASITVLERCGLSRVGAGREPGYHQFERRRREADGYRLTP